VHGPQSARSGKTPRSGMHPPGPRSRHEGDSVVRRGERPTKNQAVHRPSQSAGLAQTANPFPVTEHSRMKGLTSFLKMSS
jgi:hypothetical protein